MSNTPMAVGFSATPDVIKAVQAIARQWNNVPKMQCLYYKGITFTGTKLEVGSQTFFVEQRACLYVYRGEDVYVILPGDELSFLWRVETSLACDFVVPSDPPIDQDLEEFAWDHRGMYSPTALSDFDMGDIAHCEIALTKVRYGRKYCSTEYSPLEMAILDHLDAIAIGEAEKVAGVEIRRLAEKQYVVGEESGLTFHEAFATVIANLPAGDDDRCRVCQTAAAVPPSDLCEGCAQATGNLI